MTGHVHAEAMRLYAEDAAETDKPWERWEVCTPNSHGGTPLCLHPNWTVGVYYRRKPKTIRIGDFDVPEPMREAINNATWVYFPDVTHQCVSSDIYRGDTGRLKSGFYHSTYDAAQLHLDALLSFTRQDK